MAQQNAQAGKSNTLRHIVIFGGIGLLIGAGLFYWILWWWLNKGSGPGPMDDDERPPIIVSDGSLELTTGRDKKRHDRGRWDFADDKKWFQNHGSKPPTSLAVNVLHGSSADSGTTSADCSNANYYFPAEGLTITYAETTASVTTKKSAEVALEDRGSGSNKKKYLTVAAKDSDDGGEELWHPFALRIGNDSASLYSVTFKPSGITCDLTKQPSPRLVIFQRYR